MSPSDYTGKKIRTSDGKGPVTRVGRVYVYADIGGAERRYRPEEVHVITPPPPPAPKLVSTRWHDRKCESR